MHFSGAFVHFEAFFIPSNKLIGYIEDSDLIAAVPSPGVRVVVAESLNRDLHKICQWCDLCGLKLDAGKTKIMIVCRSHAMHSLSPPITIGEKR